MGKVFIVQEPMRREGDDLVPIMDFRPAMEYGDLEVCLSGGRVALSPIPMINKLKRVLKDFSDDDYLVAVGDPSAIAAASALCSTNNRGRINLLKWDKNSRRYIKVFIDLFQQEECQ